MPQPGLFALGTNSHVHLEFDLTAGMDPATLREALGECLDRVGAMNQLNLVLGFGPGLSRSLFHHDGVPETLPSFAGIGSPGTRSAPCSQRDLWVWLHGGGPDVVFDGARSVLRALGGCVSRVFEQSCFSYHGNRDMTGFIDGTENPPIHEAPGVALVPQGAPGEGGSHAMVQKWIHDLASFERLSPEEQEGVIGRTRPDSIELPEESRPPTSHISRVVIEEDGEELEIFRRSAPFGTTGEHGLMFVAFSADPTRFTRMLSRMFGASGDGLHDRLTEFSRPVTGSFYFVPSLETLSRAL